MSQQMRQRNGMNEKHDLSQSLQRVRLTLSIANLLPLSWLIYLYSVGAKSSYVLVLGIVILVNGLILIIESAEFKLAQKRSQSMAFLVLGLASTIGGFYTIAVAMH